jgi:hypothetical protein
LIKENVMNTKAAGIARFRVLEQEFDLVGDRSTETHYYHIQTKVVLRSSNGKLKSSDIYRQQLLVEPGGGDGGKGDKFTCASFSVQKGDSQEVTIPALKGFSYEVNKESLDRNGIDEQGQLYGIPEEIFEGLTDATGAELPFDVCYQVYSAFFYFNGYTDYTEPTSEGKGVQNLKRIGDKVIHDGAFAESPVPGKLAKEGSSWKNGEITLEFKGLTVIHDRPCAILSLDSGDCTLVMPMTYMPIMNLKTIGVSNYRADIYLDLETKWVRKLELILSEITNTSMWGITVDKSVPVSTLAIRAMSKAEFDNHQS